MTDLHRASADELFGKSTKAKPITVAHIVGYVIGLACLAPVFMVLFAILDAMILAAAWDGWVVPNVAFPLPAFPSFWAVVPAMIALSTVVHRPHDDSPSPGRVFAWFAWKPVALALFWGLA